VPTDTFFSTIHRLGSEVGRENPSAEVLETRGVNAARRLAFEMRMNKVCGAT